MHMESPAKENTRKISFIRVFICDATMLCALYCKCKVQVQVMQTLYQKE